MKRARGSWSSLAVLFSLAVLGLAGCGDDGGAEQTLTDTAVDDDDTTPQDDSVDDTHAPDDDAPISQPDAQFDGVTRCADDADCDDGLACTTDACVDEPGMGWVCAWTLDEGACLIHRVCREPGDAHPNDPCRVCDPAAPDGWSALPDGDACAAPSACAAAASCQAGACVVTDQVTCDDDNPCTDDACDPVDGCVTAPVDDALAVACDDASACTTGDVCLGGACAGEAAGCDDDNPCTDDACDPATGACSHTNNAAACDDGDPCTDGDLCADGLCAAGPPATCDDRNECTIDTCDAQAGCVHLPTFNPCCTGAVSVCEDNDPCTTDLCDPDTAECSYAFNTAPCDDSNACTDNDVCADGACGGAAVVCDDGNDCTDDACNINVGCTTSPLSGSTCDDGVACTAAETCDAGVCVAADLSGCLCVPLLHDAAKLTSVAIGPTANPGDALDINGDGTRDNALAPLASIINPELQSAVEGGSLMLLLEFINFAPGPFDLALLYGELDPDNAACDFQAATCDYLIDRGSLDDTTCEPLILLPADRASTTITGGGPATSIPFSIPLGASNTLDVTIYLVNLEMTVGLSGGQVTSVSDGLLGGAIRQDELEAAILSLDPTSLPLDPNTLISLLGTLAPNDIDTDGDGTNDAKSIALKLSGIDGVFTGAAP